MILKTKILESSLMLLTLSSQTVLLSILGMLSFPVTALSQENISNEEDLESPELCQNLQPVHTLKGHLEAISSMVVTSDSRTLLTGSNDSTINVWDIETGELRYSFIDQLGSVEQIQVADDSKTVFSSNSNSYTFARNTSAELKIERWNLDTGKIIDSISIPGGGYGDKWGISSDGENVFIINGYNILIWNAKDRKVIHKLSTEISQYPDPDVEIYNNQYLIINGEIEVKDALNHNVKTKAAEIWNLESGELVSRLHSARIVPSSDEEEIVFWHESQQKSFLWNIHKIPQEVFPQEVGIPDVYERQEIEMELDEFDILYNSFFGSSSTIQPLNFNFSVKSIDHVDWTINDGIEVINSTTGLSDCILPIPSLFANSPIVIPNEQLLIVGSGNFVQIMRLSDRCISDPRNRAENEIERLYQAGLRQLEEELFEVAENTFWQMFNSAHSACDEVSQGIALFYVGESKTLNPFDFHTSPRLFYELARSILQDRGHQLLPQIDDRLNDEPIQHSRDVYDQNYQFQSQPQDEQIAELKNRINEYRQAGNVSAQADTLRILGQVYQAIFIDTKTDNSHSNALAAFNESLQLYRAIVDSSNQAKVLADLGDLQRRAGNFSEALVAYQSAFNIYEQADEYEKFPILLKRIGDMQRQVGDADAALQAYSRAIELCQNINILDSFYGNCLNYTGQIFFFLSPGDIINGIGEIYFDKSDYAKAAYYFKQNPSLRGLVNLGWVYSKQGEYENALDVFEQVSPSAEAINSCGGYGAPDRDDASLADSFRRRMLEGELTEADFSGCTIARVEALFGQAEVLRYLGRNEDALYKLNRLSYEIFQRSGSYSGFGLTPDDWQFQLAVVTNSIGLNYKEMGDYEKAIESYQKAFDLYKGLDDVEGQAISLSNIGEVYRNQGRYSQALETYGKALGLFEGTGNQNGKAAVFHNLAVVYDELGQSERALRLYQQALTIRKDINDIAGQGSTLNSMGLVYQTLEVFEEAERAYQESLSLRQQSGDKAGEAATLNNIALLYVEMDRAEQSLTLLERALEIYQEIDDVVGRGNTLDSLGTAYKASGQQSEALQAYQLALGVIQSSGNRAIERIILSNIGDLFAQQDQQDLAILFYKQSVNVTEAIRQDLRVLSLEDQKSYTETVADTYRALANLLLEQGRIPEAQQVLDLLKLEELREFSHTTRATWTGSELAYTDSEQQVVDAHDSLIALSNKILTCEKANCPELDTLYTQLEALKVEYETQVIEFGDTIRANRAEDEIFQDPSNLSGEAEKLLNAYAEDGQKAVLIYPFVLEDKLWIVWAAAGNVIGSVEVPVTRGELFTTVQRFGELLNTPNSGSIEELQSVSQRLYDWIIKPLDAELEDNDIDHLVFVNDRVTRYIPMATLYDGEQFLLERYTISTVLAPAVTDTTDRLTTINDSQVLGLGLTQAVGEFSPLPAVAEELDTIIRSDTTDTTGIYPGQALFDSDFTLDTLKENVINYRVLHMATHAAFVPGRADESFIVLGDGNRLKIIDIETMERRLRNLHLVVLSACQTALGGPAGDGAEITGLSSYFLEPGRAETVIASLWVVSDTSTSLLMRRFYELMASGELSKAEALRQAQLSLLYNEDTETRLAATRATIEIESRDGRSPLTAGFQHPYHWAPFILIGNGF